MNEYEKSEEEKSQLGKKSGAKFDDSKSRWDLMPADVLLEISQEYTTFQGLYQKEQKIEGLKAKMLFHYSNGMECAWRFWNGERGNPFGVGVDSPLIFAAISYIHLFDLSLIYEQKNKLELLDQRASTYEYNISETSAFYLMPYRVLNYLGDIYLYGCKKYDANNWRKGLAWGRIFAAFCRHSGQWHGGEAYDKESGMHHLGHALWQLLGLRWYEKNTPKDDDRWIPRTMEVEILKENEVNQNGRMYTNECIKKLQESMAVPKKMLG